ncbi:hypothetical protein DFJ74DRAFT_27529 [Hyaloraphidium curvatum]|nr:hypothetical protein DFJ74DRAFT_27529 [Hyaloraphidium curvatum]
MLDFCYEGATGLPVSTNRVVGWHLSPTVPEALMQHNETSTIYYGSCTPEQTFDAEITWFSADVWNNTAVSPKATSNCNEDFGKAVCIGGFDFPELSSCGALAQSEILVGALSTTTTFTTTTRTTQTATTSATATPELKFIFHTIFYQSTWDCPDFDSLFNGTDVAETVTFRSGVTDQEGCILEDGTDLLTAPRTCRSRFPFITWATIQWCVEVPSFPVSPEGIAGYLIDGPIPQRIWECEQARCRSARNRLMHP